jgi:hypothetical protein
VGDFDELEGHDPAAEDEVLVPDKKSKPEPKAAAEKPEPKAADDKK